MDELTIFFDTIKNDTIEVAIWQILLILAVAAICMLLRGSKMSLLVTYVFTLHIAFTFFKQHFSMLTLVIAGIFSAIILLIGLYETFTEG